MTTEWQQQEKRKRGRPRKTVEAPVEKAEVAPSVEKEPEEKLYRKVSFEIRGANEIFQPRYIASGFYSEKDDTIEVLDMSGANNMGLGSYISSFSSFGDVNYIDPVTKNVQPLRAIGNGDRFISALDSCQLQMRPDKSNYIVTLHTMRIEYETK